MYEYEDRRRTRKHTRTRRSLRPGLRLLALLLSFSTAATGASRFEAWQADKPFTVGAMYYDCSFGPSYHYPPGAENLEPVTALWHAAGLNMLAEVSVSNSGHNWLPGITSAQHQEINFVVNVHAKGTDHLTQMQDRVGPLANHPETWGRLQGVQLADEPRDPTDQANYALQREWLTNTYPHLLTWFCEDLAGMTWDEEWNAIRSDMICFQWYPYHTSDGPSADVSPYIYNVLGVASDFCKGNGIGFTVARSASGPYRPESVRRLNTYVSLAYGVDGFLDWAYDGCTEIPALSGANVHYAWYEGSPSPRPGTPTATYDQYAQINAEVNRLGPVLKALNHVRTYHVNIPSGAYWEGWTYNFSEDDGLRTGWFETISGAAHGLAGQDDHLLVGFYRDGADQEYFMVVNKNNAKDFADESPDLSVDVTMTFGGMVHKLLWLDPSDGAARRIELGAGNQVTVTIEPGDGRLFTYYDPSNPTFAGIPSAPGPGVTVLLDDDFESGYGDGNLTGQAAPNGRTWFDHGAWHPSDLLRGDYGLGGKGAGAGATPGVGYATSIVPLGRRVKRSDRQHTLYVACDVRGGGPNATPGLTGDTAAVQLGAGDGAPEWTWLTIGDINYGEGRKVHHGRFRYWEDNANYWVDLVGTDYASASTGWFHFDASIDLRAGDAKYSFYEIDSPANSGTYAHSWDPGVYDVQFDVVHTMAYIDSDAQPPWPGVDNLYVEAVWVPPSVATIVVVQ